MQNFMQYTFMRNALLAIILVSPIFAILGTMIVNKKMAFFSDALGHSALTGIAIANNKTVNKNNNFLFMLPPISIYFLLIHYSKFIDKMPL